MTGQMASPPLRTAPRNLVVRVRATILYAARDYLCALRNDCLCALHNDHLCALHNG
jgi:hypothetical protein